MKIRVDKVQVNNERREVDNSKVEELAESIKMIGLINPIVVKDLGDSYRLIAGMHRLEAYKLLHLEEIEASIVDSSDDNLQLMEIDENLIRNEIHFIDRGNYLNRREEILKRLGIRATSGQNQYTNNASAESAVPMTTKDMAKEIGISERKLYEEKQIARDLIDEAKTVAKDKDLTKEEVKKIAKEEPHIQRKIVDKLVNGQAKNHREATLKIKRDEVFDEARKNCQLFIDINEKEEVAVKKHGGVKVEKSESIKEIALALSMFQGEVLNPKSISVNPNFNSKYAPLSEVINTVKGSLAKYGLSILQIPYTEGDRVSVETILMHNSGEWIKSWPLSFRIEDLTAQGAGAAITYARRYSISAMLNISSEEDLDGNQIDFPEPNNVDLVVETQPIVDDVSITDKQSRYIFTLAKERGFDSATLKTLSISMFGKESSKDLTKQEASSFIESLKLLDAEDVE